MAGTPTNVQTGAGTMYVAPLGTAVPTDTATALNVAFRDIGYTEAGWTITDTTTNEGVGVAEEFYPIRYDTTAKDASLAGQIAESNRRNLALALNLGAAAVNDATALEPPAPGSEVRVIGVFTATNGARWLFPQMFSASAVEIVRNKAPQKALIPITFRLEKATGYTGVYKIFPTAAGLI